MPSSSCIFELFEVTYYLRRVLLMNSFDVEWLSNIFTNELNIRCKMLFILTWLRFIRDHVDGLPRVRPLHCTPLGLTPANSPRGNLGGTISSCGDCVRAIPDYQIKQPSRLTSHSSIVRELSCGLSHKQCQTIAISKMMQNEWSYVAKKFIIVLLH